MMRSKSFCSCEKIDEHIKIGSRRSRPDVMKIASSVCMPTIKGVKSFLVRKFCSKNIQGVGKDHMQTKSRWIPIIMKDQISCQLDTPCRDQDIYNDGFRCLYKLL